MIVCLVCRAALEKPLDLYDVSSIDPTLGHSLERLEAALMDYKSKGKQGPLLVDGCLIDDLCLSFTLPGRGAMLGGVVVPAFIYCTNIEP